MKRPTKPAQTLLRRVVERSKARRMLLHPATLVTAAVFSIGLVAVPLTHIASSRASEALSIGLRPGSPQGVQPDQSDSALKESSASSALKDVPTPKSIGEIAEKPAHRTRVVAFYADWGDAGYRSLERNIDEIDVLMPMWYHIGSDGQLTLGSPKGKERVMRLIRAKNPDIKVMPIVNNYDKQTETWNPKQVAKLMRNKGKRKALSKRIVNTMREEGFDGINVDLEGFKPRDSKAILAFMKDLYPRANKAGLEVSQDVIVGSTAYDHKALSKYNDYMIPMMYDQHWKTSGPGPISSQRWYERTLRRFFKKVPPEKVIIGIGTYSYDWGRPGQRAKSMTYAEAKALARKKDKTIVLDDKALNSRFSYRRAGVKHDVWLLDAVSAHNQIQAASKSEPAGYAIWRLGAEDPDIWKVLPARDELDVSVARSLERGKRTVAYNKRSRQIEAQRLNP